MSSESQSHQVPPVASTSGGKSGSWRCPSDPFGLFKPSHDTDADSKLKQLRSQIIGVDAELDSPFGRRRITYCDSTASGRFLRTIEDYLQTHVYPFYGNTHTSNSYVGLHTTNMVHQACRYVKHCLGARPHDVLFFCGSGCTATIKRLQEVIGIAVPPILRDLVLNHLPISERWVVYIGPYEHHSNLLSWQQSIAEVVEIGLDESGQLDMCALATALESPKYAGRPKLGSFSACSNVTGIHADTRAIARLLHEHGAFACFDFASSGPYVEIDMRSGEFDGYDAVFLSPHKFLGGPGSPGVVLMANVLYRLEDFPPSTCGGGTVAFVGHTKEDTLYLEDVEEREDAGTPAIVQKIKAALAFHVKEHIGYDLIRQKEAALARKALDRLKANPNLFLLGGGKELDRQPVLSFLVYPEGSSKGGKHLHCRFLTVLFNDLFGIQARGGCACAGPYVHDLLGISHSRSKRILSNIKKGYEGIKPGFTRVSFTYYSSPEEVEFVLDAIDFLAEHGHHFLSLYNFDWRTGDWHFNGDKAGLQQQLGINGSADRSGSSSPGDIRDLYKNYICVAADIAKRCRAHRSALPVPADVDTELVDFMT